MLIGLGCDIFHTGYLRCFDSGQLWSNAFGRRFILSCLGLILVVVAGAIYRQQSAGDGSYGHKRLPSPADENWFIVFVGNFIGVLGLAVLIYLSGHWLTETGAVGAKALIIARIQINKP